jgi:hypothetical protein
LSNDRQRKKKMKQLKGTDNGQEEELKQVRGDQAEV